MAGGGAGTDWHRLAHKLATAFAGVAILTVNAGSSSIKLSLIADDDRSLAQRELPAPRSRVQRARLEDALGSEFRQAEAVAHRIVHGGRRFAEPVIVDAAVRDELAGLTDLAPLHQPKSLAALDAVSALLPGVPAVACFDTAFHATLPPAASTYALPLSWRERWGLRRFGFHGLSHSWIARRVHELLPGSVPRSRIVSCHLGAGASLCAIRDGISIDTTMGFTPLEGLVMATRSGSVDPGMLLWLLEREEIGEREMAAALEHDSGLAGLAGCPDMREVLRRAGHGDERATLALDVYLHHLCAGIAAMGAALCGLDVLVFTGGVGERADEVRRRAGTGLRFLGVELDETANRAWSEDGEIGSEAAPVRILVLRAREDLEMARQARDLLGP